MGKLILSHWYPVLILCLLQVYWRIIALRVCFLPHQRMGKSKYSSDLICYWYCQFLPRILGRTLLLEIRLTASAWSRGQSFLNCTGDESCFPSSGRCFWCLDLRSSTNYRWPLRRRARPRVGIQMSVANSPSSRHTNPNGAAQSRTSWWYSGFSALSLSAETPVIRNRIFCSYRWSSALSARSCLHAIGQGLELLPRTSHRHARIHRKCSWTFFEHRTLTLVAWISTVQRG